MIYILYETEINLLLDIVAVGTCLSGAEDSGGYYNPVVGAGSVRETRGSR